MRKIRDVLRLRFTHGLSQRAIGQSLRLSVGAVNAYLSRARMAGVGWPVPAGFDDAQLEALLYPPLPAVATERRPVPDWAVVHRELRRPNVTLALLWEEYRTGPGAQDGFGYSWFCDLYREWVGRLKPTLRQVHTAGERVFVDFAGHTMEVERTRLLIIDDWGPEPLTAEQRRDLLEIVDDRYEKGSLLVTSQVPVKRWHELMGDPTIGDAILDRVVHRAHRLELKGPSLRKRGAVSPTSESDAA